MMTHKFWYFLSLGALMILTGCSKTSTQLNEDASPNQVLLEIDFSAQQTASATGKASTARTSEEIQDVAAKIMVSIEDANGEVLYESLVVTLSTINSTKVSFPVSLVSGTYYISDFWVLDSNNEVIAAAPMSGSQLANYVNNPLKVQFEVTTNNVSSVKIDVLDTEDWEAENFGYATFSLQIFTVIEQFSFYLAVMAPGGSSYVLIPSTVSVTNLTKGVTYYNDETFAAETTTLRIPEDDDTDLIEIMVSAEGYATQLDTLTIAELMLHSCVGGDCRGALTFILSGDGGTPDPTQQTTDFSKFFPAPSWEDAYGTKGYYNTESHTNEYASAILYADSTIAVWGDATYGGDDAPSGSSFTTIVANEKAFAALDANGGIHAWGDASYGGYDPLTESENQNFVAITSNHYGFTARKADGELLSWGAFDIESPTDIGYQSVYSSFTGYLGIKTDGQATAWDPSREVSATINPSYTKIVSDNSSSYLVLNPDGSLTSIGALTTYYDASDFQGNNYVDITSSIHAFAALTNTDSIAVWGAGDSGGEGTDGTDYSGRPEGEYTQVVGGKDGFVALAKDGHVVSWGLGSSTTFNDGNYTKVFACEESYAAQKQDGSVIIWGQGDQDATPFPSDYTDGVYCVHGSSFGLLAIDGSFTYTKTDQVVSGSATNKFVYIHSSGQNTLAIQENGDITCIGECDGAPVTVYKN